MPPIAPAHPAIDFSVCENEKIRTPGAIQSHGFLWATPVDEDRVVALSENFPALRERPTGDFLGQPRREVEMALGWTDSPFPETWPEGPQPWSSPALLHDTPAHLYVHQKGDHVIYEVEIQSEATPEAPRAGQEEALAELAWPTDGNVFEAARRLTTAVAHASGYNRVMVYRFAPDWSGEIIAEWREPRLISYLGLHYPATDIPSQVRALYRENPLRVIANVNSIASNLLTISSGQEIDLSYAVLRAVSPYHVEYLQNMGVGSSLTVSLMLHGELWGLIACHHTAPHLPSPAIRQGLVKVGQRFSRWLEQRHEAEQARLHLEQKMDAAALREILGQTPPELLWRKLFFGRERLTALLHADAASLVVGEEVATVGPAPAPACIRLLAQSLLRETEPHATFFWEEVPPWLKQEAGALWPPGVCGVAGAIVLRQPIPVVVFVFRHELLQEVYWGGDPTRPVEVDEQQRLSPRKSFALWRQTIQGKSKPWSQPNQLRLQEVVRCLAELCQQPGYLEELAKSLSNMADQEHYLASEAIQVADSFLQGMALLAGGQHDGSFHILSANAKFCETFSLDTLRLKGQTVEEMLHALSASLLEDHGDRHILEIWSPQLGHRILALQRKNFLTYAGTSGGLRLELFDFQDITNDRRLREAMRVARDQARHAAELKSAVLANMSHELRTPLAAILSYSEMLAEELFGPLEIPQYKKAAQDIHAAGSHLLELVNDVLDLAKLEMGATTLQRQKINLVELVRQTVQSFLPVAEKSSLELNISTRAEVIFYYADPVRLKQALLHLLTNAVKFTPAGGRITVRLDEQAHYGVILEVQDSGMGIPADKLPHIFEHFYQADVSDLRRVHGAGLGLSIVRALVELHGGRIEVESKPGQGTRFRVSLPDLTKARLDFRGALVVKTP